MTGRTPHDDRGDYGPMWRDVAPSVLMVLAIVAVMTVLALVWTHYVGPLPLEP